MIWAIILLNCVFTIFCKDIQKIKRVILGSLLLGELELEKDTMNNNVLHLVKEHIDTTLYYVFGLCSTVANTQW